MAPKPKCFCKVVVPDCPTCTKVNWANVRPSNGDAHKASLLKVRLAPKKVEAFAACIALAVQVIVWTGPKPTPAQALETLRKSPASSNMANRLPPVPHRDGPTVTILPDTSVRTPTPNSSRPSCCDLYINGVPFMTGDLTPYEKARLMSR